MSYFRITYPDGRVRDSRTECIDLEDSQYLGKLEKFCANYPSEQSTKLREAAMRRIERETQDREVREAK